jgi:hypothetical protein
MEYTKVNGLDREVSRIGLGIWAIGGFMWGGTDEREALGTIRTAAISVNADFGPLKNSINPSCKKSWTHSFAG